MSEVIEGEESVESFTYTEGEESELETSLEEASTVISCDLEGIEELEMDFKKEEEKSPDDKKQGFAQGEMFDISFQNEDPQCALEVEGLGEVL